MNMSELPGWVKVSSGKVRDIYAPASPTVRQPASQELPEPDCLLLVTSDRVSAYDFVLPTPIPGKGKILNQLAIWWMRRLSGIIGNHLLFSGHDPSDPRSVPARVAGRAVVVRALDMIPVECVVRGYLTGSGLVEYQQSGSVCGGELPPGLEEGSRLECAIFTPAAKAALGEHDENITFEQMSALVGSQMACTLRDTSIALYEKAREYAAERGVIIADTKFEFGVDPHSGALVLADEILTPDSSRFWPADMWVPGRATPSFDKQYVRDWLTSPASGWDRTSGEQPPALPPDVVAQTSARYLEAFRRLTGEEPQL